MRRVFPLRPAETSLLVTYDNGTFEHEAADTFEPPSASAAARNLKHRRPKSTNFSVESLPSSPLKLPRVQKFPSLSDYPEFVEVASLSPPSSLWTSSFFDDGNSTSFNSSDGTHRRPTSYFSSSSSSSVNFNPGESGSSSAIWPSKDVEALLDTASSSALAYDIDTGNATHEDLKFSLRVKTRPLDVEFPDRKLSLKALALSNSQDLVQPETPTYVIPKKVEEYMQNCLDVPSSVGSSHRSVSTPKASEQTCESSANCVRTQCRESPRRVPPKPPLQRKEAESCSCSTPFKYLTKCLRGRTNTGKNGSGRQPSSSAKFSTLTNGLYSPRSSPRARLAFDGNCVRQTDRVREDAREKSKHGDSQVKAPLTASPRSLTPGRIESKESNARSVEDENCQIQSGRECLGSVMVNDNVRRVQEEAKAISFHKSPRSASFRYDSDSCLSKASRPRSGSVDFTKKSVNFRQELDASLTKTSGQRFNAKMSAHRLDAGLSKVSGQGFHVSATKVSRRRPYSMDVSTRICREDSMCSNEADSVDFYMDYIRSSDLFAAEEKNLQTLALLRLEIHKLCKEKRFLARELAAEMKARHCEQDSTENVIRHMEAEMEEKLISVEKDYAHAQACLEQEMDRRKKEWSTKLDTIRVEEKRLRDRVTEMALERVELQKAIAFHKSREASLQAQAKDHEMSAQTWMRRHRQSEEEVSLLRKSFTNACNKLSDKEHELELVLQRSKALERENSELFKEIARLRRVYADQEVTFEELWQRLVDIVNGPSECKLESLRRLHAELKAFAVREQALRYEIDILQSQILHTKQRTPPGDDGSYVLSSSRMCSPQEYLRPSKSSYVKSLETVEELFNKLELTKQHTRRVEHQLEVKEEEVELLHSALYEREIVVEDLQGELTSVKAQREGLRKQVQQMSQEAVRLTRDLTSLRQVVEKLDDELMLKEGEISILRDTCSESDFMD